MTAGLSSLLLKYMMNARMGNTGVTSAVANAFSPIYNGVPGHLKHSSGITRVGKRLYEGAGEGQHGESAYHDGDDYDNKRHNDYPCKIGP